MNILKMVKLDFLTMKSSLFLNVFILLGASTYLLFVGAEVPLMVFIITFYAYLISTGIFQVEEKNSLRKLYGALSMKKRDVVLGRYFYLLCSYLVSVLLMLFSSTLIFRYIGRAWPDSGGVLFLISASLLLFSIMVAVQTPIFMWLGMIKGQAYSTISLVFLTLVIGLSRLFKGRLDFLAFLIKHQPLVPLFTLLLSFFLLISSALISLRLYSAKI